MELEEMRNEWQEMSKKMERQQLLTDKLIIEMTQEKYKNKLKSISIPETVGTVICFLSAFYILVHFNKLDTWYLVVCGVFSMLYLIILPVKSMRSVKKMQRINISNKSIAQNLIDFARSKKQFWLVQRVGFYLSFIFIITILPISGKLLSNKDLFLENKLWYFYVPVLIVFMLVFSKWGLKHYKKATQSAENLLKELE
ncbi:hypothetical protein [Lutibacter flavus]|uniref:Uncharacterized protein n=1 Tax=Lutibacter flavus TaxID=691689 RepID=A0A238YK91_9FLAO|nr:hypothetical protein [Lutibacter flavus]SNR71402.1 hypothetical protein SAMN04488111_2647 [Lutibacter flavus]